MDLTIGMERHRVELEWSRRSAPWWMVQEEAERRGVPPGMEPTRQDWDRRTQKMRIAWEWDTPVIVKGWRRGS